MANDIGATTRFGVLTKDKRREQFGLECLDQLEWRKWEPGTEYVKYLSFKNVSKNAVTIKYKQTASKAFSMDFPEPHKIRPGMSASLKVTFRPRKMQQYSDHIELFVGDSSFLVLIEAYLPAVHIEVPGQLDFSFAPTKDHWKLEEPFTIEPSSSKIAIQGTAIFMVEVTWKLEEPFTIEPSSSKIAIGETAMFMVTFTPPEACSYNVDALCQLDNGTSALVQISGIGKFPYLSIEQPSIDFGNVVVGRSFDRTFCFGNHSVVNANFSVTHSEGSQDGVFIVAPTKGTLGPDEYTTMKAVFKPRHTGTFSSENFTITTAGGNKLILNLRGNAIGPSVSFSARSFNFGNVPCGSTPTRVLYIQNHSEVPVSYDFQLDPNDTFAISKPRSIIPAQTTAHVTITLKAGTPALYWKRVACLIKKAGTPALYWKRGLPGGDPATYMLGANGTSGAATLEPLPETATRLEGPDSWSLLFDGQDPGGAVVMDTALLEFGTCSKLSPSDYQSVVVKNNTTVKVAAFFSVPNWTDPLTGESKPVFQVFPDAADLKPHGETTFRIAFRPPRDAQHYAQTLQLCAFVKLVGSENAVVPPWTLPLLAAGHTYLLTNPEFAPRPPRPPKLKLVGSENVVVPPWTLPLLAAGNTFLHTNPEFAPRPPRPPKLKLVGSENAVVPPWTLPLLAAGNTFLHTNPEFAPKVEATHKSIQFPPCRPGDRVCQTTMLVNYGDTPCAFSFPSASLASQFEVRPSHGVVPPKGYILIGLRFSLVDTVPVWVSATAVEIKLNGLRFSPEDTTPVVAKARCLRFSPVDTTGVVSKARCLLNGVSATAVEIKLSLRFSPLDTTPVVAKARCLLNSVSATAVEIKLSGAAYTPRLTFDLPGPLFFRPTCVGASSQRQLTIHNPSRVPVGFAWKVPAKLKSVVGVSPLHGILRGNESTQVTWTFAPSDQKTYDHRIPCMLLNPGEPAPVSRASTPAGGSQPTVMTMVLDPALVALALDGDDAPDDAAQAADEADWHNEVEIDITRAKTPQAPEHEKVLLHMVGEGTGGAMALDPPSLEMGALRVGHPVKRTVNLVNQSDGVLRYSLECVYDLEEDGTPEAGAAPVEFVSNSVDAIVIKPGVEMWVDEAEGALPARASKQVTITFMPRFRKNYRMQLLCRTATVQPTAAVSLPAVSASAAPSLLRLLSGTTPRGGTTLPPLEQRPVLGSAPLGSIPPPLSSALETGGGGTPSKDSDSGVKVSSLTTICPLTALATFPTVLVSDAYIERLPKQVVWDMLGARALNEELQSNVTEVELDLARLEDKGGLTTELGIDSLRPFAFDFGVHGLGDGKVTLMVELSNITALPVHWELASADNPDLELENWVEPGQPRNVEEKARDFIVEHRIFDAKPRRGRLDASGKCTITFVYTPHFAGQHALPMFLHMTDGKRIYINLNGITAQPPVQFLRLLPAYRTFTFDPVPIGDQQPPLQTYLLQNGGPGEITYSLDLSPLKRVAANSWNYEVIQLKSGATGTIPVGGSAPISWLFAPVEPIYYGVDIPVHLGNGQTQMITLQGRGFHPDTPLEPVALAGEGERDWARWTGFGGEPKTGLSTRLAIASHDMLSLGTSLFKGVSRRVLVLSNKSVYPLCFNWDLGLFQSSFSPSNAIQAGLSISPSNGTLQPGEQMVCRVTLEAGYTPQLFEAEVSCQVSVDEEEMYQSAQAALEAAQDGEDAIDYTDTGSVIEEVIIDKNKKYKPRGGREARLRNRLPIHLYMTTAIRTRITALNDQFANTIEALTQRTLAMSKPPELPHPQTITVTLSGRVLAPNHIKAGCFIPPHEMEASKQLLAGASWVPPVAEPFWEGAAQSLAAIRAAEQAQKEADEAAALQAELEAEENARQAAAEAELAESRRAETMDSEGAEGEGEGHRDSLGQDAASETSPDGAEEEPQEHEEEGGGAGVISYTVVDPEEDQEGDREAVVDVTFSSALPLGGVEGERGEDSANAADDEEAASSPRPAEKAATREQHAASKAVSPQQEEKKEVVHSTWKPLPRPPILRPPSPPLPTPEQSVMTAVTHVLRSLLCNVLDAERDPAVLDAMDTLAPEKLPAFAQLCSEISAEYKKEQEGEDGAILQDLQGAGSRGEGEAVPTVQDKVFQVFAEFVLESAILGLVQESAAGEWEPPVEAEPETEHEEAQINETDLEI
eukprot:gene20949-27801_t